MKTDPFSDSWAFLLGNTHERCLRDNPRSVL